MKDLLHEILRRDRAAYETLYATISTPIKQDLATERAYWARYSGPVDAISDFFFDHFLKANNQPKGLRTYNEMISLLIAYYYKEGVLEVVTSPNEDAGSPEYWGVPVDRKSTRMNSRHS